MTPILFCLMFAVIGAIGYYILLHYLRREQAKIIPPDYYSEARYEILEIKESSGKPLDTTTQKNKVTSKTTQT